MKNKLHKFNIITTFILITILSVSLLVSAWNLWHIDLKSYDNTTRLLLQSSVEKVSQGIYKKLEWPYLVCDLDGKILYSDADFMAAKGEVVNVQELIQYDRSFAKSHPGWVKESFLLKKQGKVAGFSVFLIPENQQLSLTKWQQGVEIFWPIVVGIAISFAIILVRTIYFKRNTWKPMKEITASARAIIGGNYNLEVLRVAGRKPYENEVGDLIYVFEWMRDELKVKQMREEALKQGQKQMLSCISHDLRTPISTIKAYGEGLRDHIATSQEQQEEYVNIIIRKTDLLIDMIGDLLECSNAQLNQLDIVREEFYFADYFKTLMDEILIYTKQNGFTLEFKMPQSDFLAKLDRKRITEVVYNLVENSMKYGSDSDKKIYIYGEQEDDVIWIRVIDHGEGISATDIPFVFDMFYRAEKSRSSHIPGSGLGLSICKYIIEEHGGEIYCTSKKNEGCEIGFTIPFVGEK